MKLRWYKNENKKKYLRGEKDDERKNISFSPECVDLSLDKLRINWDGVHSFILRFIYLSKCERSVPCSISSTFWPSVVILPWFSITDATEIQFVIFFFNRLKVENCVNSGQFSNTERPEIHFVVFFLNRLKSGELCGFWSILQYWCDIGSLRRVFFKSLESENCVNSG